MSRFSQTVQGGRQENVIDLRYGKLHLKQLALDAAHGAQAGKAVVTLNGHDIDARIQIDEQRTVILFPHGLDIAAGQTLRVRHV